MKIKKSVLKKLLSNLNTIKDLNKNHSIVLKTLEATASSEYFRGYSEGMGEAICLLKKVIENEKTI